MPLIENQDEALLQQQDYGDGEETAMAQWNNKWNGPLLVVCPPGRGINRMRSVFSGGKKDRLFSFSCKNVSIVALPV